MSIRNVVRTARRPLAIAAMAGLALSGLCGGLPSALAAARGLHTNGSVSLGRGSIGQYAEAPNGAVYYSRGSKVYVVNGTSAPTLVVQAAGTVLALAANSSELFVDVGRTVTGYGLPGGATLQHWTLSSPYAVTTAGLFAIGGTVWAWTDWATDASGLEYANVSRFTPSSATVHQVNNGSAYPSFFAADAAGLYYQAIRGNGTNGYLVHVTPSGSSRRVTDADVDGPMAVAGGRVELLVPHYGSQPSYYIESYSATTLAHVFSRHVSSADVNLAGTGAGLLVLADSCQAICSSTSVSQLSTSTGATISTVGVPYALELLAGPSAAVITDKSGSYYLVRLAG